MLDLIIHLVELGHHPLGRRTLGRVFRQCLVNEIVEGLRVRWLEGAEERTQGRGLLLGVHAQIMERRVRLRPRLRVGITANAYVAVRRELP